MATLKEIKHKAKLYQIQAAGETGMLTKFEHTVDQDHMCGAPILDIVCGCCGNIYPKVRYQVNGEDMTMVMWCDEGCGTETVYDFFKKSGNLHFAVSVRKGTLDETTT